MFESWLEGQHVYAHRLGILAFVEKTEPHAKMINGRLVYVSKGVADYTGCLVGGKCLAVEAKSTGDNRLMRSVVDVKQARHLDAVAVAGGLSLLLVEFKLDPHKYFGTPYFSRYAVPWLDVPWMKLRTADSVSFNDVQSWKIIPEMCYLSRWHAGGKSVGNVGAVGGQHRILARE